jgi:glycosyltransferase involved in cell wall biosynthesis
MNKPLVSVICLCYNQERFVREAIQSVLDQTYSPIQLIVVDDASSDDSQKAIQDAIKGTAVELLFLTENQGNCKAFNQALTKVKGDYIIDFAADDKMSLDRIEKQVTFFQSLHSDYGVVFTDAIYMDESGNYLRDHYAYLKRKRLINQIPQGNVYRDVIAHYFVASPTMMVKKKVFDELEGYDEDLSYEDFDFWVRSSRKFNYGFLNEKLTLIRRSGNSMSSGWYKQGDGQLASTYLVCKKIAKLNTNPQEDQALLVRLRFELRQSAFSQNKKEAELFFQLLVSIVTPTLLDRFFLMIARMSLPLSPIRGLYHWVRYS